MIDRSALGEQRNALVRRVDWRFLLPEARFDRALCPGGGELARALAIVSQEVVVATPAPGSCDLAALVEPDRASLRAAWTALRPGGSLYAEWNGWSAGRTDSVRKRVIAAGFECPVGYFAWPAPRRSPPSFWIPLEDEAAWRYLLARWSGGGRSVRLARALRHAAWRLAMRFGLVRPVFMVARRGAAGDDDPRWLRPMDVAWQTEPQRTPDALSWMLLTGGYRSINKVVALGFAQGDPVPLVVVKLAREAVSEAALRSEDSALRAVHASRPGGVPGAPRPLALVAGRGTLALSQTFVTGQPIYSLLSAESYRSLALKGTRWLIALARGIERHPEQAWRHRLVDAPLARFERIAISPAQRPLVRVTREILATLPPMNLVPEQRDFSPWNILVSEAGELNVVDWESAEPAGLPLMDLIYFVSYMAIFRERAEKPQQVRRAFAASLDAATETGAVTAECIGLYLSETGTPESAIQPVRLLTWIIHATTQGSGIPRPNAAGAQFVGFWEDELALLAR